MNKNKSVLLLIGSPKDETSTSASLTDYLISELEEFGITSERMFIYRLVNREEKIKHLFQIIESTDLIVLTFPLYVDSLPAPVIKAMELKKENKDSLANKKSQSFIVISNNGFPEASQNKTALEVCRIFSKECGFIWKAGIAFGGGGALSGAPLTERGGMVRNIIKRLDIVAQALNDNNEIPQEAADLISKKLIPASLYKIMGNIGWRSQARRYDVKQKLKDKPY